MYYIKRFTTIVNAEFAMHAIRMQTIYNDTGNYRRFYNKTSVYAETEVLGSFYKVIYPFHVGDSTKMLSHFL